jgi:hypothetical protein
MVGAELLNQENKLYHQSKKWEIHFLTLQQQAVHSFLLLEVAMQQRWCHIQSG